MTLKVMQQTDCNLNHLTKEKLTSIMKKATSLNIMNIMVAIKTQLATDDIRKNCSTGQNSIKITPLCFFGILSS